MSRSKQYRIYKTDKAFEEVKGYPIKLSSAPNHNFFYYKKNGLFIISETSSGLKVSFSNHLRLKNAVNNANDRIKDNTEFQTIDHYIKQGIMLVNRGLHPRIKSTSKNYVHNFNAHV